MQKARCKNDFTTHIRSVLKIIKKIKFVSVSTKQGIFSLHTTHQIPLRGEWRNYLSEYFNLLRAQQFIGVFEIPP